MGEYLRISFWGELPDESKDIREKNIEPEIYREEKVTHNG